MHSAMKYDNSFIRRQDRLLQEDRALELLSEGEYGFLAFASCEGNEGGYGVPINYVFDGGSLWFHCAINGEKLKRVESNNRVSFCVVGITQIQPDKFSTLYESVMAFGQIEIVEDEDIKRKALASLIAKYSSDYVEKGRQYTEKSLHKTVILHFKIDHISAKTKKAATTLPSI